MNIGVVIATVGRREILPPLVERLNSQTQKPVKIVLAVPSREHAPTDEELAAVGGAEVVITPKGAAIQRNYGVSALGDSVDAICFFDDDSLPRKDYVENVAGHFAAHPECVAITGQIPLDGVALGRTLSYDEMVSGLEQPWAECVIVDGQVQTYERWYNLYGPAMSIRREPFEQLGGFDAGLPLYSWPEDREMAMRLAKVGEIHHVWNCIVAHMGSTNGGRSSHVRFGYSQIANPYYLYRKGSITFREMLHFSARPVVRNFRDAPLGPESEMRRQRALGNVTAFKDLALGRIDPQRITTM